MAYSTITKPSLHFNTKLYTGNGSTQSITGVGFQPDWLWIKDRGSTYYHYLQDAVRTSDNVMFSNGTDAAQNYPNAIQSFDTDGFTTGSQGATNNNGNNFVSWNWKAGGGQGSSNTDGSINTTYTSVNTTAGFSISQFTGTGSNATVGHGLGVVPKMYIVKGLVGTRQWAVYHESIGNTKGLTLNSNAAESTETSWWNSTSPTSSVISVGTSANANDNGNAMIVYAFAEKKGYSKFGRYTGTGNVDGKFLYLGFKPAFFLIKRLTNESWILTDNKRGYPHQWNYILPDTSGVEGGAVPYDFLSNGVKFRGTTQNESGSEYVYMAFAAEPLVANVGQSIPATAG